MKNDGGKIKCVTERTVRIDITDEQLVKMLLDSRIGDAIPDGEVKSLSVKRSFPCPAKPDEGGSTSIVVILSDEVDAKE